jgi:hypothetical protein
MIAELLAKIGVDTSDLNKAKVALGDFEGTFKKVFQRPPAGERRAEMAVVSGIEQLTSGNVPGAIEAVIGKLGVLGIASGAAFGLMTYGITKAIEASKELDAKFEGVEATFGKFINAAQGTEKLWTTIQTAAKAVGDLKESPSDIGAKIGTVIRSPQAVISSIMSAVLPSLAPLAAMKVNQTLAEEESRHGAERAVNARLLTDALQEQGKAYANIGEQAQLILRGDTEGLANMKSRLQFTDEIGKANDHITELYTAMNSGELQLTAQEQLLLNVAIAVVMAGQKGLQVAKEAADMAAARQSKIIDIGIEAEEQVATVKAQGLNMDVEKIALAQIHIQQLEKELSVQGDITDQQRAQKQAEIDKAKAEVEGEKRRSGITAYEKIFEQSQYTVQELAGMQRGRFGTGNIDEAITHARQIQQMEARAETLKGEGHPLDAFRLLARAQQLRNEIPQLKESEKDPAFAFRSAIQSATVFQEMRNYLGQMAGALATGPNPFLNK